MNDADEMRELSLEFISILTKQLGKKRNVVGSALLEACAAFLASTCKDSKEFKEGLINFKNALDKPALFYFEKLKDR